MPSVFAICYHMIVQFFKFKEKSYVSFLLSCLTSVLLLACIFDTVALNGKASFPLYTNLGGGIQIPGD